MTNDTPAVIERAPARERWSWASYEFTMTVFSMNVVTLYFAVWLVSDLHASNTMVAFGNGISSALVIVSIPIFGTLSDITQRRKPWVIGFTLLSVVATAAIGVAGQRLIPLVGDAVLTPASVARYQIGGSALVVVLGAFIIANYAHQGALPFYNAMMPELVPPNELGRLSGLGSVLASIGSMVGVLMIMPFFNGVLPVFGPLPERVLHTLRMLIPFTQHGGRVSTFVPIGVVCLLSSLPLFFFCKDHWAVRKAGRPAWRQAFRDVGHTVREARKYPGTLRFLLSSFVYQDAMGTIMISMALYAVMVMGFKRGAETTLFVVLTVPAIVGSWFWGQMTDRIGPKRTLLCVIGAWVVLLVSMMLVSSRPIFWAVGALIGFVYGGIFVADRPMLLRLIPEREAGRFFSLQVLSARAAAIIGPFIWGFAVDGLAPIFGTAMAYRVAVGTVAMTMLVAFFLLQGIPGSYLL